jgi:hypothetical protein
MAEQLTLEAGHAAAVVGVGHIHMPAPRAGFDAAHRIGVITIHPVIDGGLDLGHRQCPPAHRCGGQLHVDLGLRLGVADQRGAIDDHIDLPIGDLSRGEHLGHPRQPLA